MRRKVLQHIANTLPQMVVGWRMSEDLEKLAETETLSVTIDVLARRAHRGGLEPMDLHVVDELARWLASWFAAENLSTDIVSKVVLRLDVRSDRIPTDRERIVLFDFACDCSVTTTDRTYVGSVTNKHRWYERVGAAK